MIADISCDISGPIPTNPQGNNHRRSVLRIQPYASLRRKSRLYTRPDEHHRYVD
ncbi:MAG: hypothetical protein MZV63_04380 [Marinilabiliales bacterium]|nr:hypothetical protein [Marinilabiliales bacterium]